LFVGPSLWIGSHPNMPLGRSLRSGRAEQTSAARRSGESLPGLALPSQGRPHGQVAPSGPCRSNLWPRLQKAKSPAGPSQGNTRAQPKIVAGVPLSPPHGRKGAPLLRHRSTEAPGFIDFPVSGASEPLPTPCHHGLVTAGHRFRLRDSLCPAIARPGRPSVVSGPLPIRADCLFRSRLRNGTHESPGHQGAPRMAHQGPVRGKNWADAHRGFPLPQPIDAGPAAD
jgi:hypothetical protein